MRAVLAFAFVLALASTPSAPAAEAALAPPPGTESAEFLAATADFAAGRYAECRTAFARLARATGRAGLSARAAYGAACCAAQRGERDLAFDELSLALANDFHDVERALTDPRLEPLHGDPRWLPFLKRAEDLRSRRERLLHPTLLMLARELEAERRQPPPPDEAAARAAKRRAEALALVDRGQLKEPEDHLHAAAILVEGDRLEEVGRARALALRALELSPDLLAARPIYAAAVDRELLLRGAPQKFGTQSVWKDGRWELHSVDPAVTDDERRMWNVPPLATLRAHLPELPPAP